MVSIDEMEWMLDEIAEEFPPAFYENLNGGIILLPEAKQHAKSKNRDLYVLGEYHNNGNMGRYIAIYYGSFMSIFGHLGKEELRAELFRTLKHEFTHHLESLAGERGLEIKDENELESYENLSGDD